MKWLIFLIFAAFCLIAGRAEAWLATSDSVAAPITIGFTGHFNDAASTGTITVTSSTGTSGVLYLCVEANDATTPTVDSTTLGSWGAARGQQVNGSDGEYCWTKPFTSQLTNEIITYTGNTGGFITMDVAELNGVPTSSYFDTAGGLPVVGASTPLSITTDLGGIIIAGIRSLDAGGTVCPGFTVFTTPADYHVFQYKIVASGQTALSVCLGGGGSSNGAIADSIISATSPPLAEGFYVATTGNDGNAGTLAAPFATLGQCRTAMRASGTVKTCYVRAGTYTPASAGTGCSQGLSAAVLLTSLDNGTTWRYYPPDGYNSAVIDGQAVGSTGLGYGFCSSANNLTINGLYLANYRAYAIETTGSTPLITNNIVDGITDITLTGPAGIVTQDALNGQITHNVVRNTIAHGIASFPTSPGGVNNLLIAYNFVDNYATNWADVGGIYIENAFAGGTSAGERVEYNYVRNGAAAGGASAYYIDDTSGDITGLGNVATGSNDYNCLYYHGGNNNNFTGTICDLGTTTDQIFTIQSTGATPTGNSFTNSLILANRAGAAGSGYPCGNAPCGTTTVGPNGYHNYGGTSIVATGSLGNDSNPQQQITPNIGCGWIYDLASNSPVYNSPVSFPTQPAGWGTAGFWGPPGFTIPRTGTVPSPPHAC